MKTFSEFTQLKEINHGNSIGNLVATGSELIPQQIGTVNYIMTQGVRLTNNQKQQKQQQDQHDLERYDYVGVNGSHTEDLAKHLADKIKNNGNSKSKLDLVGYNLQAPEVNKFWSKYLKTKII